MKSLDKPGTPTTWLGDTPEARKLSLALIPIGAMMLVLGGIAQGLNWLGVPFLRGGKWRKPGSPCQNKN